MCGRVRRIRAAAIPLVGGDDLVITALRHCFDGKIVALLAGERARAHVDDGHGVPFKPLRLVHGHQHHIDRHVGSHRLFVLKRAHRVNPRQVPAQCGCLRDRDLLRKGVDGGEQRVDRSTHRRRVRRLAGVNAGGEQHVHIEIERLTAARITCAIGS